MITIGSHTNLIFRLPLLCLALMLFTKSAFSAEINSIDLISNCQELIAIYDRNGVKKLSASLSTSVAESMRAGICRGMLEEHSRHGFPCHGSWYDKALKIANTSSEVGKMSGVEKLLKSACS